MSSMDRKNPIGRASVSRLCLISLDLPPNNSTKWFWPCASGSGTPGKSPSLGGAASLTGVNCRPHICTNEPSHQRAPMTGIADDNRPAFNRAAAKLTAMGHNCGCPAEPPSGLSCCERLALDLAVICHKGDAVFILRGAEDSKGVAVEHALAKALALPVFYEWRNGHIFSGERTASPTAMTRNSSQY